jgi:hypothetical protein
VGCTERKSRENGDIETKNLAPSGTGRHRDQTLDQSRDHETKTIFGLEEMAERLLKAVADGLPSSVELARELVRVVLNDGLVKQALALDELLRNTSPLALVRAVRLAEAVLCQDVGSLYARRCDRVAIP